MGAMKRPSTKNNNNNKQNASRERKTRIRIEQGEKTAKKIENYDGKKIVRCMTTTQLYVCVCVVFFLSRLLFGLKFIQKSPTLLLK